MVIFKPSKILLWQKIKGNADFVFGEMLDVGAGEFQRYAGLFKKVTAYKTLDLDEASKPDIVASATAIPLPANSIDSIVCTQVLGDIVRPEEAIKEFYRILKSGGVVLLTESFMNELHGEPFDYWRFTKYGLRFLFEQNGFEVIKIEPVGGFWAVVAHYKIRYLIERFNLYSSLVLNIIFRPFLSLYGRLLLRMDRLTENQASQKFTLGWLIIARKK